MSTETLTTGTVTTNNIIVNTFFQIYYRLTASSVITEELNIVY
jgi:hypothetical protein